MKCKNCKSNKLVKIFKLGKQPISSIFYLKPKKNLKNYPLDLYECQKCKLVQLKELAPLNEMYGESYGYNTSLSDLMVNHMYKKYETIKKDFKKIQFRQVLDIGSNDGTFLNKFAKNKKINLFGIDPSAKKFLTKYDKKINIIVDFFSKKNVHDYLIKNNLSNKKFDLITSFAMFYDIDNPNKFTKDIFKLLSKDGIWMLEFSYLPLLLKNLTYDQICHEHITYYSIHTFQKIMSKNGFKIINLRFNEINGGSIEVTCSKKTAGYKPNKIVDKILDDERKISSNIYNLFQERVENTKKNLLEFLSHIPAKSIIGYGAATKANIVLNHLKISKKNLSYICDANPFKYNRYTPGTNIKIISKEKMRKINPNYLLVLIWSFRSEVIKQEINYIKNGGKLVFHLPMLHIIDKSNYKNYLTSNFKGMSYSLN